MPDGERFVPLEQVIAAHLDTLFPGMTIGEHDAFRVTRNADLALERGRGRRPARGRRDGAAPSAVRQRGPAGDQRRRQPGAAGAAGGRARGAVGRCLRRRRAARPRRPLGGLLARPPGPPRRDLDADDAAAPGDGRQRADGPVRGAARARRPAPPPVRLVRHVGRGVRRPGGRRPRRARDQADALPDLRRQPDRRVADPGGGGRQTGGGDRRAEGPFRRAGEHRLGPGAGRGGRPRRLRARRA